MWADKYITPCNCDQCNMTDEEHNDGYLKYLYKQYIEKTENPLTYDEWEQKLATEEGEWL